MRGQVLLRAAMQYPHSFYSSSPEILGAWPLDPAFIPGNPICSVYVTARMLFSFDSGPAGTLMTMSFRQGGSVVDPAAGSLLGSLTSAAPTLTAGQFGTVTFTGTITRMATLDVLKAIILVVDGSGSYTHASSSILLSAVLV